MVLGADASDIYVDKRLCSPRLYYRECNHYISGADRGVSDDETWWEFFFVLNCESQLFPVCFKSDTISLRLTSSPPHLLTTCSRRGDTTGLGADAADGGLE